MGGGRSYRIGELLLEELEAPMTLDLRRSAATCSSATDRPAEAFDGDAWVDLFTDDVEYDEDPFEPPLVGHNAVRAYLLEAAERQERGSTSPSSATGSSGATILAAWHASYDPAL